MKILNKFEDFSNKDCDTLYEFINNVNRNKNGSSVKLIFRSDYEELDRKKFPCHINEQMIKIFRDYGHIHCEGLAFLGSPTGLSYNIYEISHQYCVYPLASFDLQKTIEANITEVELL